MSDGIWEHHEGRDRDGEKFAVWAYIRGDGRITAKVICPVGDEYFCRVIFILNPELDKEEYHFIDVDSSKRFIVETLAGLAVAATVESPSSATGRLPAQTPTG